MSIQTATLIPADQDGSYPALTGVVPAPVGKRIGALVLELVIITVVIYGGSAALMAFGLAAGAYEFAVYGPMVLAWGAAVFFLVLQIWCLVKRGHWFGGVLLKMTHVNVQTGRPDPGKVVLKFVLQWVISSLTLGLGFLIIALASMRPTTGRNWFDRVTGLMVIDLKNGPLPQGASSAAAPQTIAPAAQGASAIASVHLPQPATPGHLSASAAVTSTTAPPFAAPQTLAPPPTSSSIASTPPPPPPPADLAQQPSVPVLQNPFGPPAGASHRPIVPVDRPGADAFIEATPFAASRPASASPPPAPPLSAPVVVNERELAPQTDFGETVLDSVALAPAGGVRELVVDGNMVLPQGQITLLGRNPIVMPQLESAVPIPLDDPAMKISKSHLAVGLEDGRWWVMDLHSTNGTVLVDAVGNVSRCEAGVSTAVDPGSVIRFGTHEIAAR